MRLSFLQFKVKRLFLCDFLHQLLDLEVLHLKLSFFDSSLCPLSLVLNQTRTLNQLYVLAVVVFLLLKIVDLGDEGNVLLHKAFVCFFVLIVRLCLRSTQMINVL